MKIGFVVNASKTNYMILGTQYSTSKFNMNQTHRPTTVSHTDSSSQYNKKILNIELGGVSLQRVSSTKFLGVIIDENLTWKNHIDAVSKTI